MTTRLHARYAGEFRTTAVGPVGAAPRSGLNRRPGRVRVGRAGVATVRDAAGVYLPVGAVSGATGLRTGPHGVPGQQGVGAVELSSERGFAGAPVTGGSISLE